METTTKKAAQNRPRMSKRSGDESQVKDVRPRDGYPTIPEYFGLVSVADLYLAMVDCIDNAKRSAYCRKTEKFRNLRHSANVLKTFANTLAANAESLGLLMSGRENL